MPLAAAGRVLFPQVPAAPSHRAGGEAPCDDIEALKEKDRALDREIAQLLSEYGPRGSVTARLVAPYCGRALGYGAREPQHGAPSRLFFLGLGWEGSDLTCCGNDV